MNMKQRLQHSREKSSRVENLVKDGFDKDLNHVGSESSDTHTLRGMILHLVSH